MVHFKVLVFLGDFFLAILNCPDSVLNLSGLMKTHYHDGSLLPLNTMFFKSFLITLNGCCDASEINILVNIKKKTQLFLSLTICILF